MNPIRNDLFWTSETSEAISQKKIIIKLLDERFKVS